MRRDGLHGHLLRCELFRNLSEAEIAQIEALCTVQTPGEGDVIFQRGDRLDSLYVIAEGSVAIIRTTEGSDLGTTVAVLSPGRAFGLGALVQPHVATATARVTSKSELVAIDGTALRFLLEQNDRLGFEVMQRLAEILVARLNAAYSFIDTQAYRRLA